MKLFRRTPPNSSTAFRLPKELLSTIDTICNELDLTRSQLFRRSITEFIKSLGHERNVQARAMSQYQSQSENGPQNFMIDWTGDDSSHDTGATREANRSRMNRSKRPKDTRKRSWISKVAKSAVSPNPGFKRAHIKRLDFSPQSLTALDEIIWTLFGGRYLCKTKLEALVWGFGGYVAEVIQRNNEGFWKKATNRYTFRIH